MKKHGEYPRLSGKNQRALLITAVWHKALGGLPDEKCDALRKDLKDNFQHGLVELHRNLEGDFWVMTPKGIRYLEEWV